MNIWMMAGWAFISLCLFSLYVWERNKYKELHGSSFIWMNG